MKIGKRETQRLARRAQIISVAREHFFEMGYDATVMSAIAAQLGGSKRTLWAHFASKEELFFAVVEDTSAAIRSGIGLPRTGATPLEQLTVLARTVIEQMTGPIALQLSRLVGPLSDRHPELVKAFYERGPRRTQTMIANFLSAHFSGLLRTEDYLEAGKDFVALAASDIYFEALWGIIGPLSAMEKDARAKRAATLFLRAYAREPDVLVPRQEPDAAVGDLALRV